MQELESTSRRASSPQNIFLVIDAMIGQDAVNTADDVQRAAELTGVILTKLDGDARGGAALSVKEVTGKPIQFLGMGESLDKLEEFRPEGLASRILGMGDIVGLMKDFEEVVDAEKAEEDAVRMLKGKFDMQDFLEQIRHDPEDGIAARICSRSCRSSPGAARGRQPRRQGARSHPRDRQLDDQGRAQAARSCSRRSRTASSAWRTAAARPTRTSPICLQRFGFMQSLMGQIGQQAGFLQRMPGMKQLAMADRLRDAVKTGGLDFNPMMANLADSLLEAAVAGGPGGMMGAKGAPGARKIKINPAKRKAMRKAQKKARKKNR